MSRNNMCLNCGRTGHLTIDCYNVAWCCEYCEKEYNTEKDCVYHEKNCKEKQIFINNNLCFRCGRAGHYMSSCYLLKHINGYYLN